MRTYETTVAAAAPSPEDGRIDGGMHVAYPHPDTVLSAEDSPALWHVTEEPGSYRVGSRVVGVTLTTWPGQKKEDFNGPTRPLHQIAAPVGIRYWDKLNISQHTGSDSSDSQAARALNMPTQPYGFFARLLKKNAQTPKYQPKHSAKGSRHNAK